MTSLAHISSRLSDYSALLKPRVMSLVIFTVIVGMFLAPGELGLVMSILSTISIAVGAGAAGAINMWYDRDMDAQMQRTIHRPLPAGRLKPIEALSTGVILSIASVTALAMWANYLSAILLMVTILYYVIIYTIWLKRRTPQNVVIGGVSGALPPVIGWTVVTGSIDFGAVFLFLVIFLWTPPHSWALAILRQDDYAAASVPMLPVTSGRRGTALQIGIYSFLLVPTTLSPLLFGFSGWLYAIVSVLLGVGFLLNSWRLIHALLEPVTKNQDYNRARVLFVYSIRYLFLIFLALIVDRIILIPLM